MREEYGLEQEVGKLVSPSLTRVASSNIPDLPVAILKRINENGGYCILENYES
jgi:hypothetical protein